MFASEIVFQLLQPDSDTQLHDERTIAVPEEYNLHLESYQRSVTDELRGTLENSYRRYVLNSYVANSAVEKCPSRYELI